MLWELLCSSSQWQLRLCARRRRPSPARARLQAHICKDFFNGGCSRTACPNAHGFADIRRAMNDASPICWKWLEGRCRVPHCKYAHTFRRHHQSVDSRRSSMSRSRASFDLPPPGGRRSLVLPRSGIAAAGSGASTPTAAAGGGHDFAARRAAGNSLDASGARRASFGHSRASIEGANGSAWRVAGVPDLNAGGVAAARPAPDAPPRNVALDGAFTQQAKTVPRHGGAPAAKAAMSAQARASMEVARACMASAFGGDAESGGTPPPAGAGAVPGGRRSNAAGPWRPPSLSTRPADAGRSNVSKW